MDIEQIKLDNLSYPHLARLVIEALQQNPGGISEYELINWIKEKGQGEFDNISFWDRLSLFQTHFMLLHTLHQLKILLWKNHFGSLDINPLKIALLPAQTGKSMGIESHDPLQEYYMDLSQLHNTTDQDIGELLAKFWQSMGRSDKKAAALAELELEDPVDFPAIKQQHRRLVMKHHPDRGGSKEKLQAINKAMEILKQLYNGNT